MLETIRQAFHLIGRNQRKRWFVLVVLALVNSLLEIMAAALIYVLLAVVTDPSGRIDLPLVGDVRQLAPSLSDRALLLWLASVMIGFFIIRAVVQMGAEYITARVIHNAAARLSVRLVRGYLNLPYSFHLRHNSSELIRNGHQAVLEVVGSVFSPIVRITAEVVMVIGLLALLVSISPLGTAIAVLVVGSATAVLLFFVQPRLKRYGATAHAMHRETLRTLQQSLHGVRDIKILGRTRFFSESYGQARRRLAHMSYIRETLNQLPRLVIETSLIGFILVFFIVAVLRDTGAQGILSTLGLFGYAGLRLQPSLQRIVSGFNSIRFSTAPTADVHRDLRVIEQHEAQRESAEPFPFEREITIENVSFAYEGANCQALTAVNLTISRGEQIGICGPTGGGKSTLVDLIAGLLSPEAGRIVVDGRDIANNTAGWQRNIGMVPQMVFLIDDTLRRNIALGMADRDIDQAALSQAIQLAQLEEFIGSLPAGLDTVVGERGIRVSGGQRQRLAIARALYNRPQVLIFDEGTSALDNATEQELMQALKHLRGDHTILLVAHRLSTVRDADRVVLIESGRVVGIDTFEGLKHSSDSFRRMAAV